MSSLSRQTVEALNIPPEEYEQLIDPAVLRWIEGVKNGTIVPDNRQLLETMQRASAEVPDEEWAKLPNDLSTNLDHYLYGSPKHQAGE